MALETTRLAANVLALAAMIVCLVLVIVAFTKAGQLPPTEADNATGGNAEANVLFYWGALAGALASLLAVWGQLSDVRRARKARNARNAYEEVKSE